MGLEDGGFCNVRDFDLMRRSDRNDYFSIAKEIKV